MKSIIKKLATQTEGGHILNAAISIILLAQYYDPIKHLRRSQFQPNF